MAKKKGAALPGGCRLFTELAWAVSDTPGELLTVDQIAARMERLAGVRKPIDRATLAALASHLSEGSNSYRRIMSRDGERYAWV